MKTIFHISLYAIVGLLGIASAVSDENMPVMSNNEEFTSDVTLSDLCKKIDFSQAFRKEKPLDFLICNDGKNIFNVLYAISSHFSSEGNMASWERIKHDLFYLTKDLPYFVNSDGHSHELLIEKLQNDFAGDESGLLMNLMQATHIKGESKHTIFRRMEAVRALGDLYSEHYEPNCILPADLFLEMLYVHGMLTINVFDPKVPCRRVMDTFLYNLGKWIDYTLELGDLRLVNVFQEYSKKVYPIEDMPLNIWDFHNCVELIYARTNSISLNAIVTVKFLLEIAEWPFLAMFSLWNTLKEIMPYFALNTHAIDRANLQNLCEALSHIFDAEPYSLSQNYANSVCKNKHTLEIFYTERSTPKLLYTPMEYLHPLIRYMNKNNLEICIEKNNVADNWCERMADPNIYKDTRSTMPTVMPISISLKQCAESGCKKRLSLKKIEKILDATEIYVSLEDGCIPHLTHLEKTIFRDINVYIADKKTYGVYDCAKKNMLTLEDVADNRIENYLGKSDSMHISSYIPMCVYMFFNFLCATGIGISSFGLLSLNLYMLILKISGVPYLIVAHRIFRFFYWVQAISSIVIYASGWTLLINQAYAGAPLATISMLLYASTGVMAIFGMLFTPNTKLIFSRTKLSSEKRRIIRNGFFLAFCIIGGMIAALMADGGRKALEFIYNCKLVYIMCMYQYTYITFCDILEKDLPQPNNLPNNVFGIFWNVVLHGHRIRWWSFDAFILYVTVIGMFLVSSMASKHLSINLVVPSKLMLRNFLPKNFQLHGFYASRHLDKVCSIPQ
ncbi:uncharacterized protein NEMAJ01_1059 [Nematocida major]|uniref:uncharacterized protein n=1 Tax=Nematocida major TaxID=1912982 RepID=UPI0020076C63|nr:uncharacterized protein NEMAJ01_1059 [Nematocida major]KAH9386163.1 hypothetical protein NEMAJ01_1059 [Nematocida major]